ncbi:ABC transporter ATP-binding protein [Stygiobacter electus]|uniref:ABC transporter ATP-binding protein n=1 Tax=Stygiobacter electus TaxID=3032292 RepID=A0AAE3NTF7_9BACT|nr:ABC transporter ATP-binding protein [Stygiobacter electus]MDF1610526.1 ABC transporter ATP-binding protein [Stygiobacter electus]
MNEIILSAENIFKSYTSENQNKIDVLKDVSLSIQINKINLIIGASGAGKSTLLHILSGLDNPDSGKVFFKDENIFMMNENKLTNFRNKHIGFVFQFHHLLPEFTALENVAIPIMISGKSLTKAKDKAKEILDIVGLNDRLNNKPSELSGGEAQRVAVARALANNPDIIFADEPTGNLDSFNSEIIHKLFFEIRDKFNTTFLIVSHNPELIKLGEIIFEMKDGKILNQHGVENE